MEWMPTVSWLAGWPGAAAFLTIEVDQRAEAARFAAVNRNHKGKSKRAGADKGFRGSADTQPYGQRVLQRSRVNTLPGERSTVLAGPANLHILANIEKESSFSSKRES